MHGATLPVSLPNAAAGTFQVVPAGSTNGTALSSRPGGAMVVEFWLGTGDSVQIALATDAQGAPTAPPVSAPSISGATVFQVAVPYGANLYITSKAGAPVYRWL